MKISDLTNYRIVRSLDDLEGKTLEGWAMNRETNHLYLVFREGLFIVVGVNEDGVDYGYNIEVREFLFDISLVVVAGHQTSVSFNKIADLLEVNRAVAYLALTKGCEPDDGTSAGNEQEYREYLRLKEKYEGPGRL